MTRKEKRSKFQNISRFLQITNQNKNIIENLERKYLNKHFSQKLNTITPKYIKYALFVNNKGNAK